MDTGRGRTNSKGIVKINRAVLNPTPEWKERFVNFLAGLLMHEADHRNYPDDSEEQVLEMTRRIFIEAQNRDILESTIEVLSNTQETKIRSEEWLNVLRKIQEYVTNTRPEILVQVRRMIDTIRGDGFGGILADRRGSGGRVKQADRSRVNACREQSY